MSTMTTTTTEKTPISLKGIFPTWASAEDIKTAFTKDNAVSGLKFVAQPCWEIAKYSPKGVRYAWQQSSPLLLDKEGRAVINAHTRKIKNRKAAAADLAEGSDEQLKVINQEQVARKKRRNARLMHRSRLLVVNGAIVGGGIAGAHQWPDMPLALDALTLGLAGSTTIGSLGLIGRRIDGGARALGVARKRSINDELLREVLANLGIPALAAKVNDVRPVSLTVENKTHFSTTLRLPMRVTATDVMARHETFAGNLDVNPDCLILDRGESASRLVVKVSKVSPAKRKQGRWNMPKEVDIFGDIAIGENVIGETMSIQIPASLLAFGKTGWGKSVFLRLVIASALQDPLVRFRLGAFKGLGDFKTFAPASEQTVAGHASSDEIAEQGFLFLQNLNSESAHRTDILSELGEPEVTRELAMQYPELRPIVAVTDEIGLLFQHHKWGKPAKSEMLKLLSNIRAQGIRLVSATQMFNSVIDSKFPGAFTNVAVFKTSMEWEGREILGGDSDAQGFKPFHFKARGEVITKDAEENRHRLRVFPVSERDARAAIARRGGVQTVPLKPVATAIALPAVATEQTDRMWYVDILAVCADEKKTIQCQQIAEALAERFPERHTNTTTDDVIDMLTKHDVVIRNDVHKKTTVVDGVKKPTTRKGIDVENLGAWR